MIALALALCVSAVDGGAPVEPMTGTWELDQKASSDMTAIFDLFEVGAIERRMAQTVTPTQVVVLTPQKMDLTVKSAFRNGTRTWELDGQHPLEEDLMGHAMKITPRYVKGEVHATGLIVLKGAETPVVLRRYVDGGHMVQEFRIAPAGKPEVVMKRVFNRKE
ncbi:MAG: hypothetical protein U0228_28595 [Myxococcaceae bacterium]